MGVCIGSLLTEPQIVSKFWGEINQSEQRTFWMLRRNPSIGAKLIENWIKALLKLADHNSLGLAAELTGLGREYGEDKSTELNSKLADLLATTRPPPQQSSLLSWLFNTRCTVAEATLYANLDGFSKV